MTGFSIRSAKPADAQAIANVQIAAWQQRLSKWAPVWFVQQFDSSVQTEKYRLRLEDASLSIFVAEDSSRKIVGVIGTKPNTEEYKEYDVAIFGFYVLPEYERQRIGTTLLRYLLSEISDKDAIVFTFADNIPARQLYEACGGALLSYTEYSDLADIGLRHVSYGFGSKKNLTYEKFAATIESLSSVIHQSGFCPDIIVAIARGGWIPARLLSKYIGVKKLYSYGVIYADEARTQLIGYDSPNPKIRGQKILLVEDYLESGKSMNYCAERLSQLKNEIKTFAVGYSDTSLIVPDYTSRKLVSIPKLPWD